MRRKHLIAATVATIGVAAAVILAPHHSGNVYPDPSLSPGLIATSDFATLTQTSSCGTYSQCHRQTSNALKQQVRAEYPNCPTAQEIDHIVPLALGGADNIKNLWCQSGTGQWNYHDKDKLETYLVNQMKAGKISPVNAQQCILTDWIRCYQKYLSPPSFGSVDSVVDPDNI